MSVEERLMAPGRWDINLREDTPPSVRALFNPGNQIIITPAVVRREMQTTSTLLSLSHYTGVLLSRGRRSIGGAGLDFYLGDSTIGDVLSPSGWVNITDTFRNFMLSLFGFGGGATFAANTAPYTLGTFGNIGAFTYNFKVGGQLRKPTIQLICTAFGGEYRINHDNTVDADTAAGLFGAAPWPLVLPKGGVRSVTLESLQARELEATVDARDFMTGWFVVGGGEGNAAVTDFNNFVAWADDLNGNDLYLTKIINAPDAGTATEAAAVGIGQWNADLGKVGTTSLSADAYDIGRFVKPGESLRIYDPDQRLYDTANQLNHGGRTIFPMTRRVFGVTWPIQAGMGVYYRMWNTGAILDLTPWVEFEDGTTVFDIGAPPRPLVPSEQSGAVERRLR